MRRALFTSTHETSFILEDLSILRRHLVVDHVITRGFSSIPAITRRILTADVTYTWFASVYAWLVVSLARLLGKKSIVAVGGADVAKLDAIGYGLWTSGWKSVLVGSALRRAWRVLPVDESLKKAAMHLAKYDGANIRVLPTGFDASYWRPAGAKERLVLSVAAAETVSRLKVKGYEILVAAARHMPDVRVEIIGPHHEIVRRLNIALPPNVTLRPAVSRDELLVLYQHAAVYCQSSLFEGFPNALGEAMLCGCVPVATNVGGTGTALGDIGFLVPPGDPAALATAVLKALDAPPATATYARERIQSLFTLEKREAALLALLDEAAA